MKEGKKRMLDIFLVIFIIIFYFMCEVNVTIDNKKYHKNQYEILLKKVIDKENRKEVEE